MDKTAIRLIGFSIAGAAVLVLAEYSPKIALYTVLAAGLGLLLTHPNSITSAIDLFKISLGK